MTFIGMTHLALAHQYQWGQTIIAIGGGGVSQDRPLSVVKASRVVLSNEPNFNEELQRWVEYESKMLS